MKKKLGFTLIEIMVVITLIAILAAIALPCMIAYRKTAHEKACMDNIHHIRSACRANELKTGIIETDLDKLVGNGTGFLKWKPQCPVGGTYEIKVDPQTEEISITCSKADADEHNVTE